MLVICIQRVTTLYIMWFKFIVYPWKAHKNVALTLFIK